VIQEASQNTAGQDAVYQAYEEEFTKAGISLRKFRRLVNQGCKLSMLASGGMIYIIYLLLLLTHNCRNYLYTCSSHNM
jgi:hypothetical protein